MTTRQLLRHLCAITASALVLLLPATGSAERFPVQPALPQTHTSVTGFGKLPLSFETNQGQIDAQVKFLARGQGYTLFLLPTETVLALTSPPGSGEPHGQSVLRMKLLAMSPSTEITGLKELPGKAHYFLGNNPKQWRTNVPTYQEVRQKDIYPGIDLIYYGKERQLEYDFVVAPGADPRVITLAFEGQEDIRIEAGGNLILDTAAGQIRLHKPLVYQERDGAKQIIASRYVLQRPDRVSIDVAAYDSGRSLIIDPVLSYSTYLGGNGTDRVSSVAVDTNGNAYLAGITSSADFPTTTGVFDQTANGGFDVFVAKLNPTGTALVYSTYFGGSNDDFATDLSLDAAGNAYVTGVTSSLNFPTTAGVFQASFSGGPDDTFVTKFDPAGSALVYSTYLGGTQQDHGNAIAIDAVGNAYVTGDAQANFPTTTGAFSTAFLSGDSEVFVTKVNATGTGLVYSTAIPGAHPATDTGRAIAVDAAGNAYVSGVTRTAIATTGAFQISYQGGTSDGFVLKLNPTGSALVWATNLGSSGLDEMNSIAVDQGGNVYLGGIAHAATFPTTTGAFQTTFGGGVNDAVVAKLNPTGSALIYSTFLGGNNEETSCTIALDLPTGTTYFMCGTKSTNLLTTGGPFQATHAGASAFDCYVGQLNDQGTALIFASYLGGNSHECTSSEGVVLDQFGNMYAASNTVSTNFPTTAGSFQATDRLGEDGFVAKITFNTPVGIDIKPGSFPNSINLGSNGTVPVAILGSADFDASQVDPITVSLAGASVKLKGKGTPMASLEDVNFDGFLDMVVHVSTEALQLSATDSQAVVEGQTVGGTSFRGIDSVRVVPAD